MLPTDIHSVLQWWFIIFLLGTGFLPLTFYFFEKFYDSGYTFSKLIAIAVTSYVIFLLGVLRITPFTQLAAYCVFILLAGIFLLVLPRKWKFKYFVKKNWRIFLIEELVFLIALFSWAYIHSFNPDIHGLEKYMDFGFINSTLRASYFPPKDMWFTPLYINYYYFGHFMTAVLTRLSGLPSSITFDLMLSTIFAFCFTETFSIGLNLFSYLKKDSRVAMIKRIVSGLLTAMLVTFAGNLHIIYAFFKPYTVDNPVPVWQLPFLPSTFPNSYWYPNATRFIFHTIHEFPIYSWTVADLHGHVLDIPFVLLTIALLLSIFIAHDPDENEKEQISSSFLESFLIHPLMLIAIGFLLSIMYMTNAWDGAIYMLLAGMVIFYLHWQNYSQQKKTSKKETNVKVIRSVKDSKRYFSIPWKEWYFAWGRDTSLSLIIIIIAFAIFGLPYNAFFKPFVSGIGVLCAPDFLTKIGKIGPLLFEKDHCQRTYWWEFLMLYGFFYYFVLSFIVFVIKARKLSHVDIFVLLLMILSTILIIIPEFIYVKDIYPAHYRANTMFKLVFQSFIMLSISSGYVIFRFLWVAQPQTGRQKNMLYLVFFPITVVLVGLVMMYPYFAIKSYYGELKTYHGLDGTTYLQTLYPTDAPAIMWLNQNVKGQPVILEAQGDSYTDYARISANTGLPTVLGWIVHEWLWRGTYDIPAPRIAEVKTMYETTNPQAAKALMQKYTVAFVFIGTLEFQKYPQLSEAKFGQLGKLVYQNGITKIYQLNN